jgi:hypothetical protein
MLGSYEPNLKVNTGVDATLLVMSNYQANPHALEVEDQCSPRVSDVTGKHR